MHIVVYPKRLKGKVHVSGNKNSALPVLAASILVNSKVQLNNIPNITDVGLFLSVFKELGLRFKYDARSEIFELDNTHLTRKKTIVLDASSNLGKIRASILLLGALVTRFSRVIFRSSIGGCKLGARSLEVHFNNLKQMGVNVKHSSDEIILDSSGLKEARDHTFIWQAERSVTATELALIIATGRKGRTTIFNAASEPHVIDTGLFLQKLGHQIEGLGTDRIEVIPNNGTKPSGKLSFTIFSDYYEVTTWLAASLLTKGRVSVVHNIPPVILTPVDRMFAKFGIPLEHKPYSLKKVILKSRDINTKEGGIIKITPKILDELPHRLYPIMDDQVNQLFVSRVKGFNIKNNPDEIKQHHIVTFKPHPWPGFPVDLLPLFIPIAAYGKTPVLFHNWMYDRGLTWAYEFRKAGMHVIVSDPHRLIVIPGGDFKPTTFESPYIIRATISMILFAMSLKGPTTILNADPILRAHPFFMEKIQALGARLEIL